MNNMYKQYFLANLMHYFNLLSSGVNGKPAYCISFHLGRNYKIRKKNLSTGYLKRHYIRLSTGEYSVKTIKNIFI